MILLNDEKIHSLCDDNPSIDEYELAELITKAQLREAAKVIGSVLDGPDDKLRLALSYIWQVMLKEADD